MRTEIYMRPLKHKTHKELRDEIRILDRLVRDLRKIISDNTKERQFEIRSEKSF
jgi:hypothetical protein